MWFWWLLYFCGLQIPILMIICGFMMYKHPSKEINGVIGYRTSRSMKNMDTWIFAHKYCGKMWWKIGLIVLIFSIIIPIFFYKTQENLTAIFYGLLIVIQALLLFVPVILTEKALKVKY